MFYRTFALAAMLCGGSLCVSQSPVTASKLPVQSESPAPGQSTPLRVNTRLVVVDVVVSDRSGSPVHKLKQSDFVITENGKPQAVTRFEEHTAEAHSHRSASLPKLDPGTVTNYIATPTASTVNVVLLDSLNTPLADQAVVREQILSFLKSSHTDVPMVIFGLNQRLHLLQGLTSNPDALRRVFESRRGQPQSSLVLDDGITSGAVGTQSGTATILDSLGNNPAAQELAANLQSFEARQQSFDANIRAQYTLDAMNSLARYLSGIPGRKNLIWFSGSFPINLLPDGSVSNPFAGQTPYARQYADTVAILESSQVSIYPIDARGLQNSPSFNASTSGAKYARNPNSLAADVQQFHSENANEHSVMTRMAEDTGGKAFFNTNGLGEAVERAIDAGSNYYTLVYSPTDKRWNGDFRKIQVRLNGQQYQLAYRRGYYAKDPDGPAHGPEGGEDSTSNFNPMHVAMLWGGPQPTQIIFAAKVRPVTGIAEPNLAGGTVAGAKAVGPYERYNIFFVADPQTISSNAANDGKHHIAFEFVTYAYDDQGALITSNGSRLTAELSDDRYNALLHGGLQYHQQISVPVKGSYYLRMGIHDLSTDRVGAVEIYTDDVRGLTPLAAIAPR